MYLQKYGKRERKIIYLRIGAKEFKSSKLVDE